MLRNSQNQVQSIARQILVSTRNLAAVRQTKTKQKEKLSNNVMEFPMEESLNPFFLSRNFGSSYRSWSTILEKHPELKNVKRQDLTNSIEALKFLNFKIEEIISKPMVMYYNASTLSNRHLVLQECGFQQITIAMLAKYVTVMNKSIVLLKSHQYIPYDLNVAQRLLHCFTGVELQLPNESSENMPLKELRQILLNQYLRIRLDMSDSDLSKMWKIYSRVRHKSFKAVQEVIDLLLNDLNFPKERIRKNIFLAHADADNIKRIIHHLPTIDGNDIRVIMYKRPKIMMSSCDALQKTLQHVHAFGIGEDAILRCLEVLTLGPDTVLERLRDLNEIEEFKVLGTNPRILRLVHYQNKARLRLEYLNQLKVRCASLHILSCGSEAFAKFARDGSDRTKGRDIVVFLANIMQKDENNLRSILTRHPNWCHIPVVHVKQCYEYLLSKKFLNDDIYHNIHLLLYPIKRIEEKMLQLQTPDFLDDLHLNIDSMHEMSNRDILTLILYLIESEFHFTGDGIWTEQHTHHVENFNNLLPDFPESLNKVYKYGVKPAEKVLASNM